MDSLTTETVAELLRGAGYRAQVTSEQLVLSATNGLKFGVFVDADGWIQCRLALTGHPGGTVDADICNNFNMRFRFAKMYLDDDRDVSLSADFFVGRDATAEATRTAFTTSLEVWDTSVGSLRRFLDQNKAAESSAPAIA